MNTPKYKVNDLLYIEGGDSDGVPTGLYLVSEFNFHAYTLIDDEGDDWNVSIVWVDKTKIFTYSSHEVIFVKNKN